MIGWVLDPRCYSFFLFYFTTCKKIYIQNNHSIGKRLKYPRIYQKFTKMPLPARVAHARLLLVAARFSGEISGQPMVGSGRSKVEDSVGGGLDGR